MSDVTQILSRIEHGDPSAADRLLPLIYNELQQLAASRMGQERADHSLQAIALFDKRKKPVLADPTMRELVERAVAELQAKTAGVDALIHLAEADWAIDQEARTTQFEREWMRATAAVQIIGTFNTADGTWLWAWDHPSIEEPLRHDAFVVLEYGQEHNIDAFTNRMIECQESDWWEFTALACKLCDAQGAYRGPAGDARVFATFGELSISSSK